MPTDVKTGSGKIVVAMSGGVDSSVAALLLVRQGFDVIGISMRLWAYEKEATHGCCTPEDLHDARRVADTLGIPYYVANFEESFEKHVIQDFVGSYGKGETPNPCVRCNQDVKFKILMQRTSGLGATKLATGHYARKTAVNGKPKLMRAKDERRDQSYFLFGLDEATLNCLEFPLGDLRKEEVRRLAREANLPVADKPDSQEICFVPGDYSEFVEKRLPKNEVRNGNIVDYQGQVLGGHDGVHHYTIGQRRGLGIPSLLPLYVESIGQNGDVVVGPADRLYKRTFEVRDVRWTGSAPTTGENLEAQIRSRFVPAKACVEILNDGKVRVAFGEPQRAITPGQAAVFYRGDEVLGGGWIDRVLE